MIQAIENVTDKIIKIQIAGKLTVKRNYIVITERKGYFH